MDPVPQASSIDPGPHLLRPFRIPKRIGDVSVRERELALGMLALGGAALALVVPLTARTLAHPGGFAALTAASVVGWILAGLLWWRARPWSRIGPLLCAIGFLIALQSFQGSANGLAFSFGVLFDLPTVLLAWYLALIFPGERLDASGRLLMGIACAVLLLGYLPRFLLSVDISGATPLARCDSGCPPNHLMLASEPGVANVFQDIERWGRVAITLLIVGVLSGRFLRASRPRRRTLLPVYAALGLWLISFAVYNTAVNANVSVDVLDRIGLGVTVSRLLYPLAFIAALVLARAYAGGALQTMVHELRTDSTLRSVDQTVRSVLADPSSRLAFWLPQSRQYVDAAAHPVELPAPNSDTSVHVFRSAAREPLVAIAHDPALDEDPELLEAAGEATVMVLENRRLDEELRRAREALILSERRLGAAVTDERKRIERDLHDGSQQRLVAIRIGLELARERAEGDPESHARLAKLGEQLDHAVEELRGLVQGIYPSVLPDFGLRAALKAAAERSGVQVDLDLQETPRYPAHLEAGVYFACVEALQNAAKHAGSGAHVKLRLWTDGGLVCFCVSDDGIGFTPGVGRKGLGLRNMADRLAALDGTFSLETGPGKGTDVTGSVPVGRLAPI
ncbi:MAG: histidine kinase [Thermoleophilaceae bacterium]